MRETMMNEITHSEKLYHVRMVVPEFELGPRACFRNVEVWWFVTERAAPIQRPYADLILDYDAALDEEEAREGLPDCRLAEGAIDELFSKDEAEALVEWLKDTRPDGNTEIRETALPLPQNTCGFGFLPCGGGVDNMGPRQRDGASMMERLGFMAYGYYDLRTHDEPIEGSERIPLDDLEPERLSSEQEALYALQRLARQAEGDDPF
jgi:hypothetical protein